MCNLRQHDEIPNMPAKRLITELGVGGDTVFAGFGKTLFPKSF